MTIETLSARLERVERENRTMRRVALAFLVLAAAGTGLGLQGAKPSTIQAQGFRLVGPGGEERGSLSVDKLGNPSLVLNANKGEASIAMTVTEDWGPKVVLFDKDGATRGGLGLAQDGTATLHLNGPEETHRSALSLDVGPTEGATARLWGVTGGLSRIGVEVPLKGKPGIVIRDPEGQVTRKIE